MIGLGGPERCAFCGRPIGPDEAKSGRGEIAAHVACADAALGDEAFWDRIASAAGEAPAGADREGEGGEAAPGRQPATRAGCGILLLPGALVALFVAVAHATWP